MKQHNPDYHGISISLTVVDNGFLVREERTFGHTTCHMTIDDAVNRLAGLVGCRGVGESVVVKEKEGHND